MAERPASPTDDRIAVLEAETARLEAELLRLRESDRKYRFSAALAGRLVWVADPDGNMQFLDSPFVVLTGMSAQDGIGSGWLEGCSSGRSRRYQGSLAGMRQKR
jgi:PAS domain-containing protein